MRREIAVAVWVGPKSKDSIPATRARRDLSRQQDWSTGAKNPARDGAHKRRHRTGMDITWLTDRIEFDDRPLGMAHGIEVLWNPTDDDFEPKPAALFERGVDFAQAALERNDAKLFIHCAAGVHRAPMMALAVLGSMGWRLEKAMELIEGRRPVADFAEVYVRSVEKFLRR